MFLFFPPISSWAAQPCWFYFQNLHHIHLLPSPLMVGRLQRPSYLTPCFCPRPLQSTLYSTQITSLPPVAFQCPSGKGPLPLQPLYDLASNLVLQGVKLSSPFSTLSLGACSFFPSLWMAGFPCQARFLREAWPDALLKETVHTCLFLSQPLSIHLRVLKRSCSCFYSASAPFARV